MKCAYLLIVASAAFVTCKPQTDVSDVIWYPVENEDGVFISKYGERHRTPSKGRRHRWARYSGMEEYPSYIPPTENYDPSFFHNIHERRPFRRPNGFRQYPTALPQNLRPFHNSQQNQKFVSFYNNRAPRRPDHQGLNEDKLQEAINEVFNFNKNPFLNQLPGQRPLPQNRPTNSEVFTTTTTITAPTRRPFQRPATNEWFVNPNPSQRPSTGRPNRPDLELVVFPGETAKATPTTPTPTDLLPTETTTLTTCERRCPVTLEFNPVCGTDSFTYTNFARLKCARYCGKEVELSHYGQCGKRETTRSSL